jgi:hypothetical protein
VYCGPLSPVFDFLELIGEEFVPTLKIEIVPDGMVYMYTNLNKIWSYGCICSKGPNMAIQHRFHIVLFADST